jgi:hypothetical protein
MAIEFQVITPKTSISSLHLILNDNFKIAKESTNKLLQIIDIGTGKFDNSSFGTDNNVETQNIKSKGPIGVEVNLGNVTISTGNLKLLGSSSRIEIGTTVKLERIVKNLTIGTTDVLDLSGTSGAVSGDGTISAIVLPRMNASNILDIQSPIEGLLAWDTTNKKVKVYNGTTWEDLN